MFSTATDWAQVNMTKSEGSSAIWTPHLKKWVSIDPLEGLDPVAPRPLLIYSHLDMLVPGHRMARYIAAVTYMSYMP